MWQVAGGQLHLAEEFPAETVRLSATRVPLSELRSLPGVRLITPDRELSLMLLKDGPMLSPVTDPGFELAYATLQRAQRPEDLKPPGQRQ